MKNDNKKINKDTSIMPVQTLKSKEARSTYDKKNPVLRTKEERKEEVRIIINKLNELKLTVAYDPIKTLFKTMQKYINEGGKIPINIPFPMIERRIKGLLPDTVNEKCWVKLVKE